MTHLIIGLARRSRPVAAVGAALATVLVLVATIALPKLDGLSWLILTVLLAWWVTATAAVRTARTTRRAPQRPLADSTTSTTSPADPAGQMPVDQQLADRHLALAVGDLAADMADTTHERDQADNKATGLLGGAVAALTAELAALIALAGRLGPWGTATLLASVALLIAATGVLAAAIRPATASGGQLAQQWGHVRYARLSPAELLDHYLDQTAHPRQRAEARATALHCQAQRVTRKYRLVRRGVDLGAAALVLAAAAAALAALT